MAKLHRGRQQCLYWRGQHHPAGRQNRGQFHYWRGSGRNKGFTQRICVGGVPARQLGRFDEFIAKRKTCVNPESDEDKLWAQFERARAGESVTGE